MEESMRKAMLIGTAAAVVLLAGCGQSRAEDGGPTTQRSYQVGSFNEIEVAGPYDVKVTTGSGPTVSASGPEKLIERLVVEVKGNKLLIHPKSERNFHWFGSGTHGTATIEVSAPALRAAAIAGSGTINVDKVTGADFDGSIGGSGDLMVESIDVKLLKLAIGGSGSVRAGSGRAQAASSDIGGSGDIDAEGVQAENASISIAGSGSVAGQATGSADVNVMGSGDVSLTGGAKCNVSKMGSGDVRCT
jgi:hypothetical protein